MKRAIKVFLKILARIKFGKRLHADEIPWNLIFVLNLDRKAEVHLGKGVSFRKGCVISVRDNARLAISDDVFFNNNVILTCRDRITIGRKVLFGPNVLIFDHDHDYSSNSPATSFCLGPIKIGEEAWICGGAVITKNCTIGKRSIIAANAVARGDIEDNTLCGGIPCRVLKRIATSQSHLLEA